MVVGGRKYVRWAEDCAVPVCHEEVVAFVQAVGARLCCTVSAGHILVSSVLSLRSLTCSKALLALLQLLQQPEVARDFGAHLAG